MEKASHKDLSPESGTTTPGDDNTIIRCSLRNSAITTSCAERCTFEDCILTQVRSAHRSTGRKSHFYNARSLDRSDFVDSVIRDRSSVRRSTVTASTIRDASVLKRSTVSGSTVSNAQVERSGLDDCDVENCMISRSEFKGMILKYGVWKRGRLVGAVGNKEPIMIKKDSPEAVQLVALSASVPTVPDIGPKPRVSSDKKLPYYDDSDFSMNSDNSEGYLDDLPPPYKV